MRPVEADVFGRAAPMRGNPPSGQAGPARYLASPRATDVGTGSEAREPAVDLLAVFRALRRRSLLIVTTTALLTLATVLTTLAITPRYRATASVLIRPGEAQVVDLKEVAEGIPTWAPGDGSAIATEIAVLRSRSLIQGLIDSLGLGSDPELDPRARPALRLVPPVVAEALLRSWIAAAELLGIGGEKAGETDGHGFWPLEALGDDVAGPATSAVIEAFLDRLTVAQEGEAHVISVSFTSTDPAKSALITNALVDRYIADQLQRKSDAIERARAWIGARVAELREQVRRAESAVGEYRATHGLAELKDGGLDAQRLASVQAELATARAERTAKEARLAQARQLGRRGERYESLTEVISSPTVTALRQREAALEGEEAQLLQSFGAKHPQAVRIKAELAAVAGLIRDEVGNIVRNLASDVAVARLREQALERSLAEAQGLYADAGRAAVQLRELEREASAARALYERFLARSKEIEEQRDLLQPDVRIVSAAAAPDEPSFPRLGLTTAVGFAGSLTLGLALAALLEHLDRGLRGARQVEEALGLPVLGLVPKATRRKRGQSPVQYLVSKPLSAYAEAIKTIRITDQLSRPSAPSRVLLVTSALPAEGKTTVAVSLGISAARSGYRTIVVDLDLRRPHVAPELGQTVRAGLAELLAGEEELDRSITAWSLDPNLHVLGVKRRVMNPTELLGSPRMADLVHRLRSRYDRVILDSPPALGLTDASLAALLADSVLFVIRWGTTSPEAAASGIAAVAKSQVPVAGIVLTQVDMRQYKEYGADDAGTYFDRYQQYFVN